MKYKIRHQTTYRYSEPASLSQNELILRPRNTVNQKVIDSRLTITPEPRYLRQRTDYFGNEVHVFMVEQIHSELIMIAESQVETALAVLPPPESTVPWEDAVTRLVAHNGPAELDAFQFVFNSPMVAVDDDIRNYAMLSFAPGTPIMAGAMNLMERIFTEFTYDKTTTTVDTPLHQVLAEKSGVCQDFAHLAVGCLRSLGLAAQYVSGYLETQPPPGKPKLEGADASHAWVGVFVPEVGWVYLDPTNNVIPGEQHITLAWGRDYSDVTPVKGVVLGGGVHSLDVMVDVSPHDTNEAT